MRITDQTLTKTWSVQDLASIIHADASDTYSKYAEAFAAFSSLDLLQEFDSLSYADKVRYCTSVETEALFDNLYNYIKVDCDNQLTITMNDGDILWFETYDDIDPQEPEYSFRSIRSVYKVYEGGVYVGNREEYICRWHSQYGFSFMAQHVHDISGEYNWSLTEILASIADSMNSCLLYTRLTTLVQQGTVTIADIDAAVNNISFAAGSAGQTLVECLKDLGTNLNSATILRLMQQTFRGMASTSVSPNDDTIDWNDNDYMIKGYAGTIIKNALIGAAQVVGTILVYAGAVVVKIAGALIMLGGIVLNALWNTVEYVAGEKAKYNPLADTKEFPMPIWQNNLAYATTVYSNEYLVAKHLISDRTRIDIMDMVSYMCPEINEGFVIKFATPVVNFYFWKPNERDFYCEAYLTTLFKGKNVATYSSGTSSIPGYGSVELTPVMPIWEGFSQDGDYNFYHWLGEITLSSDTLINQLYNNEEYCIGNSPVTMNQDSLKLALNNSIFLCCLQLYESLFVTENPYADHSLKANQAATGWVGIYTEWMESNYGLMLPNLDPQRRCGAPLIVNLTNVSTCYDACDNIFRFLGGATNQFLYIDLVKRIDDMSVLATGQTPNDWAWSALLNQMIPSLSLFGFELFLAQALGRLMPNEYIQGPDYAGNYYADYYYTTRNWNALNSLGTSIYIPTIFRQDYEIQPPTTEPGTTLKVVLITAAITTAIVIGAVVTRTVLKKKLRNVMGAKYTHIESLHDEFKATNDPDKLTEFNKAVRKYNFIAGLVGYSTLSYVNGWECGDGSSQVQTIQSTPQAVEDLSSMVVSQAQDTISTVGEGVSQQLTSAAQNIVEDVTGVPPTSPETVDLSTIKTLITG